MKEPRSFVLVCGEVYTPPPGGSRRETEWRRLSAWVESRRLSAEPSPFPTNSSAGVPPNFSQVAPR